MLFRSQSVGTKFECRRALILLARGRLELQAAGKVPVAAREGASSSARSHSASSAKPVASRAPAPHCVRCYRRLISTGHGSCRSIRQTVGRFRSLWPTPSHWQICRHAPEQGRCYWTNLRRPQFARRHARHFCAIPRNCSTNFAAKVFSFSTDNLTIT